MRAAVSILLVALALAPVAAADPFHDACGYASFETVDVGGLAYAAVYTQGSCRGAAVSTPVACEGLIVSLGPANAACTSGLDGDAIAVYAILP